MQNTQIHKTQKGPAVEPQPLQTCTFNETSIFYEHTKDQMAEGNPPGGILIYNMKTITEHIIYKI